MQTTMGLGTRFREHSLEEGATPSAQTIGTVLLEHGRHVVPWRAYAAAWLYLALAVLCRTDAAEPPRGPPRNPADLAGLYATMQSADVAPDADVDDVVIEMRRTMAAYNHTHCLAAIHIGVPLRVAIVVSEEDGETVLVNPRVVTTEGLDKTSSAKERSPFWPEAKPRRVRRAFPVFVRDRGGVHVFEERVHAHCVHHLMDAFEGR